MGRTNGPGDEAEQWWRWVEAATIAFTGLSSSQLSQTPGMRRGLCIGARAAGDCARVAEHQCSGRSRVRRTLKRYEIPVARGTWHPRPRPLTGRKAIDVRHSTASLREAWVAYINDNVCATRGIASAGRQTHLSKSRRVSTAETLRYGLAHEPTSRWH